MFKQYIKSGRKEGGFEKLFNMTTNITTKTSNSKKNYFDHLAEKLFHPKLNRKAYWSIPKSSTNLEKVAIKPPLLLSDHIVTNVTEKTYHFKDILANQCSGINKNSKLTLNKAPIMASLLRSVNIKDSDILNILKSLDVSQVHAHAQLGC